MPSNTDTESTFYELPGTDKFYQIEVGPKTFAAWAIEGGKRHQKLWCGNRSKDQLAQMKAQWIQDLATKGYLPAASVPAFLDPGPKKKKKPEKATTSTTVERKVARPGGYVERFLIMVRALEGTPGVTVTKCEFGDPLPEKELLAVAKKWQLDPAVLSLWSEADGLEFSWRAKQGKGNIHILPLKKVFGDWTGTIWFDGDERFKNLHPVDFFAPEACAAFLLDGSKNPKVCYHYCGEDTGALDVDLAGYLELLLKTRGFLYWQTAVVSDRKPEEPEYTTEPAEFRRQMPKIFSDFALTDVLPNAGRRLAKDAEKEARAPAEKETISAALKEAKVEFIDCAPRSKEVRIEVDGEPGNLEKAGRALVELGTWTRNNFLEADFGSSAGIYRGSSRLVRERVSRELTMAGADFELAKRRPSDSPRPYFVILVGRRSENLAKVEQALVTCCGHEWRDLPSLLGAIESHQVGQVCVRLRA